MTLAPCPRVRPSTRFRGRSERIDGSARSAWPAGDRSTRPSLSRSEGRRARLTGSDGPLRADPETARGTAGARPRRLGSSRRRGDRDGGSSGATAARRADLRYGRCSPRERRIDPTAGGPQVGSSGRALAPSQSRRFDRVAGCPRSVGGRQPRGDLPAHLRGAPGSRLPSCRHPPLRGGASRP